MENSTNRKILLIVGMVLFFAVIVIVYYFFYMKPVAAPTLRETNNPIQTRTFLPRFQFLFGEDPQSTSTTEVINPEIAPLIKIWDKPATGQTFITKNTFKETTSTSTVGTTTIATRRTERATTTALLFVDKITGYIYSYSFETRQISQITNTLVPGVYDAYFFNNSKQVLMRYIDREKNTVRTLTATVPEVREGAEPLSLERMTYLSGNVTSIAVDSKKEKASYLISSREGSTIYTLSSRGVSLIASSPFSEWNLTYGGDTLYATTKASAYVEGTTVRVPGFIPEISERTGLISKPSDSNKILNSMWSSSGLLVYLLTPLGEVVLPIKTIASKCAWEQKDFLICGVPRVLPRGGEGLPDDWFQGRVMFNDDLYLVDTNTGNPTLLYEFTNDDGLFDITNIVTLSSNNLISFTRKQDDSLWLLDTNRLNQNTEPLSN